jgi:type IV pilus biogenesis protein CpaD/CtpE
MDFHKVALAVMIVIPVASPVLAQSVGTEVQRDINQETRVEQGLKSGQLSTGEAAKLERGEARIDRMESKALKDGNLSQQEAARIQGAQNRESERINRLKHNDVTGNPNSASSQRMQADVQRNINQQGRIEQGVQSGALTNREASQLERGQAHVDRAEARAGADGHVGAREQVRIQHRENKQSRKIFRDKHNARMR